MTDNSDADRTAAASRAFDSSAGPLTFLKHIGSDDVYHRGPEQGGAIFAIPGMWETMPPNLLAALRARRRANVTGRCPACGAAVDAGSGTIRHESFCAAGDDRLQPALDAWSRRVGSYARGRRIVENPA